MGTNLDTYKRYGAKDQGAQVENVFIRKFKNSVILLKPKWR
jgi:hypothetical protein